LRETSRIEVAPRNQKTIFTSPPGSRTAYQRSLDTEESFAGVFSHKPLPTANRPISGKQAEFEWQSIARINPNLETSS